MCSSTAVDTRSWVARRWCAARMAGNCWLYGWIVCNLHSSNIRTYPLKIGGRFASSCLSRGVCVCVCVVCVGASWSSIQDAQLSDTCECCLRVRVASASLHAACNCAFTNACAHVWLRSLARFRFTALAHAVLLCARLGHTDTQTHIAHTRTHCISRVHELSAMY
jgi:hypothetical protein